MKQPREYPTPTQWREWAKWMLMVARIEFDNGIGPTHFDEDDSWGTQVGTVEERALYALFIAEFIETEGVFA